MSETILNFDPNMVTCGKMTKQIVRVTLGVWEHRKVFDVDTGGNVMGLDIIETAVDNLFGLLLGSKDIASVELMNGDETLTVCDDLDEGEDWLRSMVVSAEVVSIEPAEETA